MKNALCLFMFLPLFSIAQVDLKKIKLSPDTQDSVLGTSLILKENTILFQKVYESELSKSELKIALQSFLPAVKSFQLTDITNQTEYQFSGRLSDYNINYRKFGGTFIDAPSLLNYPIIANVIIQVKDNKYRVTISEIIFKSLLITTNAPNDRELDDVLTRKERTLIKTNSNAQSVGYFLDKDFSLAFDIKKTKKLSAEF